MAMKCPYRRLTLEKDSNRLLTMKERKRSERLRANDRKAVTVQTIIELAAEQNPAEITTSAMAERMHMTQGALFRHFASKDAIWQEVMEWVAEHLLARVDKAAQVEKSPLKALEAVFMAHIRFVVQYAGVPRILFGELQRPGDSQTKRVVRKLLAQYGKRLRALIDQGKSQGELEPEIDTGAAAALFIGAIQGLIMQSLLTGKSGGVRAKAPKVFAIYLRGIRRVR